MQNIAAEIFALLQKNRLTLGAVESATGGLISHLLTNIPGISEYYKGSVTAYANETKMSVVGVDARALNEYGAVSAQVAEQMAAGGRKTLNVGICVADTGIAGPGGATPGKPVGLFYLGLACGSRVMSRRHVFSGSREEIKSAAAETALIWVKEYLESPLASLTALPEKHVVTSFLECGGKILILKRSQAVGSFRGRWAGISGYMEHPDDEQSLIEIEEETGLRPEDITLVKKGSTLELDDPDTQVRWVIHPYLYRTRLQDCIKTDWEHCETRWVQPEDLDNFNTVPMLKEALKMVLF
jgi:nicotinamide-nucleotide amidase